MFIIILFMFILFSRAQQPFAMSKYKIVFVRHGESEWNKLNLFTGWYDCDLSEVGRLEAAAAGKAIKGMSDGACGWFHFEN